MRRRRPSGVSVRTRGGSWFTFWRSSVWQACAGVCAEPGATARDGERLRIPQGFRAWLSARVYETLRPVFACSRGIVNSADQVTGARASRDVALVVNADAERQALRANLRDAGAYTRVGARGVPHGALDLRRHLRLGHWYCGHWYCGGCHHGFHANAAAESRCRQC